MVTIFVYFYNIKLIIGYKTVCYLLKIIIVIWIYFFKDLWNLIKLNKIR